MRTGRAGRGMRARRASTDQRRAQLNHVHSAATVPRQTRMNSPLSPPPPSSWPPQPRPSLQLLQLLQTRTAPQSQRCMRECRGSCAKPTVCAQSPERSAAQRTGAAVACLAAARAARRPAQHLAARLAEPHSPSLGTQARKHATRTVEECRGMRASSSLGWWPAQERVRLKKRRDKRLEEKGQRGAPL